ncbi:hypothetical protein [Halomarina pelagica]|uniref:hypothetical protein n=1 Tax=Halomarina pelagica TaxID=2961599 RepID=UPI0020C200D0|nr:hypothetical protein [Halomarina sp. BND7]
MSTYGHEEPSSRPRQVIHDAQQYACRWHELCVRAHQGVAPDDVPLEAARRMFHSAAINYWKQIERFKHESHIARAWSERVLWTEEDGGDEISVTLDDIGEHYRFRTKTVTVDAGDITTGETPTTSDVAVCLTIEQATRLVEALDEMAHRLGFDASVQKVRPKGVIGDAEEYE